MQLIHRSHRGEASSSHVQAANITFSCSFLPCYVSLQVSVRSPSATTAQGPAIAIPNQTTNLPMLDSDLDAYRGHGVIVCSVVLIVSCTVSLALRFISHHIGGRTPNPEDWLMIPAWALMMGLCATLICSKCNTISFSPSSLTSMLQVSN